MNNTKYTAFLFCSCKRRHSKIFRSLLLCLLFRQKRGATLVTKIKPRIIITIATATIMSVLENYYHVLSFYGQDSFGTLQESRWLLTHKFLQLAENRIEFLQSALPE